MQQEKTLGERLQQIMSERKLNYETLGNLLDMKPQTLNRYVLGQREPKAGVVMEMAARLDVDARWLQGYDVPERNEVVPGAQMLPIVRVIQADNPQIAQEDIEGWAPAAVGKAEENFYLRVHDDSMAGADIRPDDLVLIHRQNSAESGQIVACFENGSGSAHLVRFRRQGDFVILQPENPNYEPRILTAQDLESRALSIIGVAQKLVRNL